MKLETRDIVADNTYKGIKVSDLKVILEQLPVDAIICATQVGNLVVLDKAEEAVGYIDLMDDKYRDF